MATDLSTSKSEKAIARLGADIAKLHKSAFMAAQSAIGTAIQCGEKLLAAKETVAHGEWTDFVETHCKMSLRSAQRYMKAAKDETIKLPFFDDIPDPFGNQKNVVAIRREIDQWPACHLSSAVDELKRIAGEVSR